MDENLNEESQIMKEQAALSEPLSVETFQKEITSAGFELVEEIEIPGFKENYFLKFKKK